MGLLCLWYGTLIAQDIGSSLLTGDTDPAFFAGLLDELARWWDSLGPMGQLLVTALGVMLLMTAGASFALAMGTVGVMTWAMAHEHGLASFINNPAAATGSYLANVTAGQLAWDLLDFALTFVPGSVLGAGAHTIARTTARDMAATRTALRQGGKKAAKATEQAAARTEARSAAAGSRGTPPKRNGRQGSGGKPRPGGPFPDVQSVRGHSKEEALKIIPEDWIRDIPRKEPNGMRFRNLHVKGEVIICEPGSSTARDPLHGGPQPPRIGKWRNLQNSPERKSSTMIDPTVLEVLFMGFEGETSAIEAFNAVRKMENLDTNSATIRTCEILTQLTALNWINLWLGNPYTRAPEPHPGDPNGTDIVTSERVRSMDDPDGRMLVYDITADGEVIIGEEMGVKRSRTTPSE